MHWFGLLELFLWALLIWMFLSLVFRTGRHGCCNHGMHHGNHGEQGKDALDIARERYAKGEIDEKEFEKIKKTLS